MCVQGRKAKWTFTHAVYFSTHPTCVERRSLTSTRLILVVQVLSWRVSLVAEHNHSRSAQTGTSLIYIYIYNIYILAMKLRPDGLASFLPALRDASLLVLLHRLLKAGQTAGELMSLSSSLSQQPRKILNCLPKWLFLFPSIRQFGGLQFGFLICIFAYVCKQLFTSIRSVYYWFWPVWT